MGVAHYESRLNCSLEGLFDFMSRPTNVAGVSDPSMGITFFSAPDVVEQGSRLEFQLMTFGQTIKAVHQIVQFQRPQLVIEEQVSGPMKVWTHRHEYETTPDGVVMRDSVTFQLPTLLALMLNDQKVQDHLADGFFYRERKLQELVSQGVIA